MTMQILAHRASPVIINAHWSENDEGPYPVMRIQFSTKNSDDAEPVDVEVCLFDNAIVKFENTMDWNQTFGEGETGRLMTEISLKELKPKPVEVESELCECEIAQ